VETFLSPGNTFVLLCIGALALLAFEPVRAALSASCYVDARVRAEGLDLRAAIEDAIAHSTRRPRSERDAQKAAAVVLALACCAAGPALAQEPPPAFPPPPMEGSSEEPAPPIDLPVIAIPDPPRAAPPVALGPEDE